MPQKTDIEWTDYSSNPLKLRLHKTGKLVNACIKCSPGCSQCYAQSITHRWWPKEEGEFPGYTANLLKRGEMVLNDAELQKLLTFKPKPPFKHGDKPKVFIGDMSDIFGEFVPFELIDQLFAVFALRPDVIFQVLTKRPERMAEYFDEGYPLWSDEGHWPECADDIGGNVKSIAEAGGDYYTVPSVWPLPNVWLGTSCEDQPRADERIPHLLKCPAAIRFISAEPLIGPIDLHSTLGGTRWIGGQRGCGAKHRGIGTPDCPRELHHHHDERCRRGLDLVIMGGESGPKARECHLPWIRNMIRQCQAVEAPPAVFVKQLGSNAWSAYRSDHLNRQKYKSPLPSSDIFADPYRLWLDDRKGGAMEEWPEDLRVRQMPV